MIAKLTCASIPSHLESDVKSTKGGRRRSRAIAACVAVALLSTACASDEGPTALIYRDHPVLIGPTLYLDTPEVESADNAQLDSQPPHARFAGRAEYVKSVTAQSSTRQVDSNTVEITTTTTVTEGIRDDINKQHYRATAGRNDVLTRILLIRPHCWGTFPVFMAWGECQVTLRGEIHKLKNVEQLAGRKRQ